jgi:outer membrane protein assembly factor BamE (lipoprotein component of BamABCDE complex)
MRLLTLTSVVLSALLLSSCGSIGRIPSQQQIAQVIPNKTTSHQTLALLGKPFRVEKKNGNQLFEWALIQISASEGLVHSQELQVLVDSSGVVRKKNQSQSTLQKSGFMLTDTYAANSSKEPSLDQLSPGITGGEAELKLGRPFSRKLRIDGGLDRTWITSVRNVYLVTNIRPKEVVGHFDPDSDRLVSAEVKR